MTTLIRRVNMLSMRVLFLCLSLNLVRSSESQDLPSAPTLQQGYGTGCLARNGNCIIVKICNVTLGVGPINITIFPSECIQGQAVAQLVLFPTPRLDFSISNVTLTPPSLDGSQHCNCTACPVRCTTNAVASCSNSSLVSGLDNGLTGLLGLLGVVFAGSGNFCAVQSANTSCLAIILCNLKAYNFLGIEVEQGDLPPICAQGVGNFTARLSVGNPFSLQLSDVNFTSPFENGGCPCTSCQQVCVDNPVVGCLPTGVSPMTVSPYPSSTSSSSTSWTTSSSCLRSTTAKPHIPC